MSSFGITSNSISTKLDGGFVTGTGRTAKGETIIVPMDEIRPTSEVAKDGEDGERGTVGSSPLSSSFPVASVVAKAVSTGDRTEMQYLRTRKAEARDRRRNATRARSDADWGTRRT